jgi:hypothetical protein
MSNNPGCGIKCLIRVATVALVTGVLVPNIGGIHLSLSLHSAPTNIKSYSIFLNVIGK